MKRITCVFFMAAIGLTLVSLLLASRGTMQVVNGFVFLEHMALMPLERQAISEEETLSLQDDELEGDNLHETTVTAIETTVDDVNQEDHVEQQTSNHAIAISSPFQTVTPSMTRTMTMTNHTLLISHLGHQEPLIAPVLSVPPYTQADIIRLARARFKFLLHLLIFDGTQFQLFSVSGHSQGRVDCGCDTHFAETLIDGFLTARPHRFRVQPQQSQRPFQVLLATVHDNVHFKCIDRERTSSCSEQKYPPLLTFGSAPKNTSTASFLHLFPTKYYNDCIYHWRHHSSTTKVRSLNAKSLSYCRLQTMLDVFQSQPHTTTDKVWDALIPQVFWRGSNLNFLVDLVAFRNLTSCQQALQPQVAANTVVATAAPAQRRAMPAVRAANILWQQRDTLMPRCLAVAMTLRAKLTAAATSSKSNKEKKIPWINVKFTESGNRQELRDLGLSVLVGKYTTPMEMSKYKYQIDFGGMGGTTWLGTITKLAMPGLLFHHETPTKDWFHDELQPWVHYVPIHTNLSNLRDMYLWAETHPEQAKRIAKQGQEYARAHLSDDSLNQTFHRAFVQRLGPIVDAYQPRPGETMESIVKEYQSSRLFLTQLTTSCTAIQCHWKVKPPWWQ